MQPVQGVAVNQSAPMQGVVIGQQTPAPMQGVVIGQQMPMPAQGVVVGQQTYAPVPTQGVAAGSSQWSSDTFACCNDPADCMYICCCLDCAVCCDKKRRIAHQSLSSRGTMRSEQKSIDHCAGQPLHRKQWAARVRCSMRCKG